MTPTPTFADAGDVLDVLRHEGYTLTGLPVGSRPDSLLAARVEGPDAGARGWPVAEDLTRRLLLSGQLVERKTRSERYRYAHRDPVPADAVRVAGDGQADGLPELAAMPALDFRPVRRWAGVVDVDAPTARAWLARNTDNRPLSRSTVRRYARLMADGRWMVSTDAVGFDLDGKLVNGQHRLTAAAEHGEAGGDPVPMLVATGLSPAVFAVLDAGKPRSGRDVLHIRGFRNAATVASCARLVAKAEAGALWRPGGVKGEGGGKLELDELVRRAEADRSALVAAAAEAHRLYGLGLDDRLLVPAHAALVVRAWADGEEAAVVRFLERLATGIGVASADDPAHVVRQAFLADQRADVRMGRAERLAVLLRGAQHAALGRPMKRARGKGAGAWPSPEVLGWPKQTNPALVRRAAATSGTIDDPEVLDDDAVEDE